MNRIKMFFEKNRKAILVFVSGFCVAICIFGVFTFVEHKKLEQEKIEVARKEKARLAKKKRVEQKKKEEKEKTAEEKNQSSTENFDYNQEGVTSNYSGPSSNSVVGTEADVISYFRSQEALATGNEGDINLRERLKNGVNTMYQFLFHGGTIYGKTFSELTSSAKLQVLKIALAIDQKIDTYFPNYKDNIKAGASNLKAKIVTTYLETTNRICSNHEDICSQAREDFATMKKSFKITFSLIRDLAVSGSAALKEWYLSR